MGKSIDLTVKSGQNGFYIFIVDGEIEVADSILSSRDAIGVWETETLTIKGNKNSELIIIEVPMN